MESIYHKHYRGAGRIDWTKNIQYALSWSNIRLTFYETPFLKVSRFPVDWYAFLSRVQCIQKVSPKSDPQGVIKYVKILLLKCNPSP